VSDPAGVETRAGSLLRNMLDLLKRHKLRLMVAAYVVGILFVLLVVLPLLVVGIWALFKYGHIVLFGDKRLRLDLANLAASGSDRVEAAKLRATEFNARIEAAKVFFPVLVTLIGGPVLIWRAITAHWAAQAARHQADTAREGHYTDLFTKAVEQLGATREVKTYHEVDDGAGGKRREAVTTTEPNLEVRLGAIYALDRVARDSERDHWPIMQVLCAYVRNPQNCGAPVLRPEDIKAGSEEFRGWLYSIRLRVDVQAALAVIGERPERRRELEANRSLRLDLRRANLQRAALDGIHFERAVFDEAHLDGASFYKAHLDGASFIEAHLDGASFIGAHLNGASFIGARLDRASFIEARLDRASFDGAHLDGARFTRAHLDGASFDGAHLDGARFTRAHLDGASFIGAHLDGARFTRAHLDGSSFDRAHFDSAFFDGAQLDGASFFAAQLDGALFFHVDLSKARGLDPAALESALGDASTKLPDGMGRPAAWPDHELSDGQRGEWFRKTRAARVKEV
jgi:uncharacterized protein YjbI with pentapeptide repeats